MADLTIIHDNSLANQALDLARQNAADAAQRSGKSVVGAGQPAPQAATLGATAVAGSNPVDSIGQSVAAKQTTGAVNTDAPALPNPMGPSASPTKVLQALKGSEVFGNGGDSMFAAMQAFSESSQRNENLANETKRLQGQNQVNAKTKELVDKQAEIHGQMESQATKLAGSIVGALSIGAVSFGGSRMESNAVQKEAAKLDAAKLAKSTNTADVASASNKQSAQATTKATDKDKENFVANRAENGAPDAAKADDAVAKAEKQKAQKEASSSESQSTTSGTNATPNLDTKATWWQQNVQHTGAAMRNLGMGIGGLMDNAFGMVDITVGGLADANKAALAQKQDVVQAQIFQNNADSASAWKDSAKEHRKGAQQAITQHVQMVGESISGVWR